MTVCTFLFSGFSVCYNLDNAVAVHSFFFQELVMVALHPY